MSDYKELTNERLLDEVRVTRRSLSGGMVCTVKNDVAAEVVEQSGGIEFVHGEVRRITVTPVPCGVCQIATERL